MFETVVILQTSENAARSFFFGLAMIGGVMGAFIPPIGKLGRLAYFALALSIYGGSFALLYVLGQSEDIPLVFWGYLLIGILTGIVTAWVARARSADIVGDGRYAFLGFIPFAALYLVFTAGRSLGAGIAKSKTTGTKNGLGLAAIFGIIITYGATGLGPNQSEQNQFAKEVANSVVPQRIDDTTLLVRAEAVGNRLKFFYTVEGPTGTLTEASFEKIKEGVCSDSETSKVLVQAGVDREYIYLDEKKELIGSFIAGC